MGTILLYACSQNYKAIYEKWPQNLEFFIKTCVFILTCLSFSHLQSTLHLLQYTHWDCFPTAQNSFWTRQFGCFLVLLQFFVSPVPRWQNVSLWGLFSSGETNRKIVTRGKIRWIWRVGHRGHAGLGQKLLNTQWSVDRCAHKSPIMKWASVLKESSKNNSLEPNTASHTTTSWYTVMNGFLEHSPSRESLYYKGPLSRRR